jgi:hypothetical protein
MTQLIEYIQTAKEFADAYGIAHLDRLLALAETVPILPKLNHRLLKLCLIQFWRKWKWLDFILTLG